MTGGADRAPVPVEYATALIRAYTRPKRKHRNTRQWWVDPHPTHALFFDTETTDDADQRLLFGVYRLARCDWSTRTPQLTFLDEGLIYADELPRTRPRVYAALRSYAQTHRPAVDPGPDSALTMGLYSRSRFVEDVLYRRCYEGRAMVVGFNLPFDLTRLALGWGKVRRGAFAGGFTLQLYEYVAADGMRTEDLHRPRIRLKPLGQRRSRMSFASPAVIDRANRVPEGSTDGKPAPKYSFPGHFLDLMRMCFALTGRPHSLVSACGPGAFDVRVDGRPYRKRKVRHGRVTKRNITYCREDVEATAGLFVKAMAEHERHPIDQPAEKIYSPASYTKGYLRALGIKPPLERNRGFPTEVLGYAMGAYFGGRVECHLPQVPAPVIHTDFLSMYPTVCLLLGVWEMLTCGHLEARELDQAEIDELQAKLDALTAEELLKPETWQMLRGVALVDPSGARVPLRTKWDGQSTSIGVVPVTSEKPLPYAFPDLAAAMILGERKPRILRAWEFVPKGRARGLRPVKLRGKVLVDPRSGGNMFRAVIEERAKLPDKKSDLGMFLKTLANAIYGVFAEINRTEDREPVLEVHGLESFELHDVEHPERPGEYCFPPIACLITAGARLMLAILESLITYEGGTYAFCDTDSMAIVATEHGGLVPCPGGRHRLPDGWNAIQALSRQQVNRIVDRFEALNPYDRNVISGILKIEDVNYARLKPGSEQVDRTKPLQLYAYAISPKRYALYNLIDGRPDIRDCKEHGLGYLLSPIDPDDESGDWIRELWEYIVSIDALGLDVAEPRWLLDSHCKDRIAMGQLTFSTPELMDSIEKGSNSQGVTSISPHTFVLTPHVAAGGHPVDADPTRFQLLAGYTSDRDQWPELECIEKHTGRQYRIAADDDPYRERRPHELVYVKTYRQVLHDYRRNDNPTALGPDGHPATSQTVGLLQPRPMHVIEVDHIGAATKMSDEMSAKIIHDEDETLRVWGTKRKSLSPYVGQVLIGMSVAEGAQLCGLSEKTIKRVRSGSMRVSDEAREKLELNCARLAHEQLIRANARLPRRDLFGRWLRSEEARKRMERDPGVTQISPRWTLPREELLVVLAAWADRLGAPTCKCGCGRPVSGRRAYRDRACQVRAYRARGRHRAGASQGAGITSGQHANDGTPPG